MSKTVNKFDDLMTGLVPALAEKYDSVELMVNEDHETYDLLLEKGKKKATVHLSHELVDFFFAGDNVDETVGIIGNSFKDKK